MEKDVDRIDSLQKHSLCNHNSVEVNIPILVTDPFALSNELSFISRSNFTSCNITFEQIQDNWLPPAYFLPTNFIKDGF